MILTLNRAILTLMILTLMILTLEQRSSNIYHHQYLCILLSVLMTMLIAYRFPRVGSFTKIAEVHPFPRQICIALKTGCAEPETITQPYIVH